MPNARGGRSNKQRDRRAPTIVIASVEIHILHACKQLQARTRVHAVAVALRHKLLDAVDSGPNADKS